MEQQGELTVPFTFVRRRHPACLDENSRWMPRTLIDFVPENARDLRLCLVLTFTVDVYDDQDERMPIGSEIKWVGGSAKLPKFASDILHDFYLDRIYAVELKGVEA